MLLRERKKNARRSCFWQLFIHLRYDVVYVGAQFLSYDYFLCNILCSGVFILYLKWDDSSPSRAYSAVTLDDVSHWDFAVIYGFSVILHIEISLRYVMFSLFCCSIWYQSLTCWATAEWKKSVISINVDHCYRCRQGRHIALSYNWNMTRLYILFQRQLANRLVLLVNWLFKSMFSKCIPSATHANHC